VIGHPDEDEVERWRTSDTAILRSDLHRALGRRMVRPDVDGESVASRRRSARPPRDNSAATVRPPDRDRAATRWSDATKESLPSDVDLIEAVRGGAVEAYGKLYARHLGAARNLARQLARSPTPEPPLRITMPVTVTPKN
jgi:hypothetical protein